MRRHQVQWLFIGVLLFVLIQVKVIAVSEPDIKSESALLIDAITGQILYSKEVETSYEVGSLSQLIGIAQLYYLIDEGQYTLDTKVTVSQEAHQLSQDLNHYNVPLRQDQEYEAKDLIQAVLTGSANGAMLALAESAGQTEANFLTMMDQQLQEWGAESMPLASVTGHQTTQGNRLTTQSVAIAAYHLLQSHPEVIDDTQKESLLFQEGSSDQFQVFNQNEMVQDETFASDGLFFAKIADDQYATVQTRTQNGFRVIAVLLGSKDKQEIYQDTRKLFEYAFATYRHETILQKGSATSQIAKIVTENGKIKEAETLYGEQLELIVPVIDTAPRLHYEFVPITDYFNEHGQLIAPVIENTTIGHVQVEVKGETARFIPGSRSNLVSVQIAQTIDANDFLGQVGRNIAEWTSTTFEGMRKFFNGLFNE